ncbi:MAG: sugar phosphate isomerase/epimerase [Planctomycetota bacterium]|nr:sugar phosphate isomerase/epimerase [Planctomycetota bacterium]MDA1250713.1 sugar phosphate isomerase/epimerase [Planctomycetota bacterium]
MTASLSRRGFLATGLAAGALAATTSEARAASKGDPSKFRYCLNTSTIRGQKIPLDQEIDLAAKAGYDGIEPWIREIEAYVKNGGKVSELRKRIDGHGLKVESAIGFANWIVNDEETRKKALEQAKVEMSLVRELGGTHIAAPPAGATRDVKLDLFEAARHYHALLEVGRSVGVIPQVEVWGFSENLARLGEAMFVAIEAGHPDACLLPDVYHIFKGGSDFAGLKMIAGTQIHCFHVNDYPAEPPRETISDKDRVYPGDGIAPLNDIFQTLAANGFQGALSLELFNPTYWSQDAEQVCKTGLAKSKEAVARAFD